MASTTIKLSVETRDRIRAFGGETYEETIVEALDLLDAEHFWAQADAAKAFADALPPEEKARRQAEMDSIDAALDALDG